MADRHSLSRFTSIVCSLSLLSQPAKHVDSKRKQPFLSLKRYKFLIFGDFDFKIFGSTLMQEKRCARHFLFATTAAVLHTNEDAASISIAVQFVPLLWSCAVSILGKDCRQAASVRQIFWGIFWGILRYSANLLLSSKRVIKWKLKMRLISPDSQWFPAIESIMFRMHFNIKFNIFFCIWHSLRRRFSDWNSVTAWSRLRLVSLFYPVQTELETGLEIKFDAKSDAKSESAIIIKTGTHSELASGVGAGLEIYLQRLGASFGEIKGRRCSKCQLWKV